MRKRLPIKTLNFYLVIHLSVLAFLSCDEPRVAKLNEYEESAKEALDFESADTRQDLSVEFKLDVSLSIDRSFLDEGEPTDLLDMEPEHCEPIEPIIPVPSGPLPPLTTTQDPNGYGDHEGIKQGGIDHWESASYQRLVDTLELYPEIHFIATWDNEAGQFVMNGGEPAQRVELRIERSDTFMGSSYELISGELAGIFPNRDPRYWGSLESLYEAYEARDATSYSELGYLTDDPRFGLISRSAQIYPDPIRRILTLFEAPHAPDVVYGVWPGLNGGRGSHGGLGLLQSRATLLFGGAGVRSNQMIEREANLTDILPTIMAALGAPTTSGIGPDGFYEDGLYLKRQDGRVLWEALNLNPCERPKHVVVILYDGLMANEMNHLIHTDSPEVELPNMRTIMQRGSTYLYGASPGFPTMSAAGHITSGIGLLPGHSGVLSNSYFDRSTREIISPFVILEDPQGFLSDRDRLDTLIERMFAPNIETAAEALHRAFGEWDGEQGAFVAVINELMFRGADFSTPKFLNPNGSSSHDDSGSKSLQTYQIADRFAVLQTQRLLDDMNQAVPTLLQTTFLTTDKAGEQAGPHSNLVREVLVELDVHVGTIMSAYERRGALSDTMFVFISDHGMELQEPNMRADLNGFWRDSGVGVSFAQTGLLYFTSLKIEVRPIADDSSFIEVYVSHHDTDEPVENAVVRCSSCLTTELTTDQSGQAILSLPSDTLAEDVELIVEADGFTPLSWPLR